MRGNRPWRTPRSTTTGSIPAHAGKPRPPPRRSRPSRVYPRPCGETAITTPGMRVPSGLSPPMRGNLQYPILECGGKGSIPAHAGKPESTGPAVTDIWVYPRPCGETLSAKQHRRVVPGLSPPMRGNLVGFLSGVCGLGSIPAHAGKPASPSADRHTWTVYPRPCGETLVARYTT